MGRHTARFRGKLAAAYGPGRFALCVERPALAAANVIIIIIGFPLGRLLAGRGGWGVLAGLSFRSSC